MKAIILVKDKDKAKSIYSESMMDKFGFNERLIAYTKEEIATDVKSFTEVKYIFSTWYMPTFNEKEIRDYSVNELKFKPKRKKQKITISDEELKALEDLEKQEGKSKLDDN